jgi:hypothetical protein
MAGKKWPGWNDLPGWDSLPTWDDLGRRANAIIDYKIETLNVRADWDSLGGWGEYPMDDQDIAAEAQRRIQERRARGG